MNLITLENISKQYSEKILLNNVSLGIDSEDKIGIIGINGTGKSTLLRIIAGKDEFYEGKLTKGKNIRAEYLEQNGDYDDNKTVIEQIFNSDIEEMRLLKEYELLIQKSYIDNSEDIQSKLLKLQSKIDDFRLWDLESDAKIILNKLGIKDYDKKMGDLSGGQKKRVFLAQSLITPSDILILDEPTNHLDSETISWLENYLNSSKKALIMITHDRYFLDRVTNKIIELDRGELYSYPGNYSDFLIKKMERLEEEKNKEFKRQALIRNELKWVKRGAKARTTKQKARLQRFDQLTSEEYNEIDTQIEIETIGTRLGKKIIELDSISKEYDNKLIDNFSYIFNKEDRIGVIGKNGMGKSTLLNILAGKVSNDSGSIEIGETVKIGFFTQEGYELDSSMRVIDFIKEGGEYLPLSNGDKITASTLCEKFLFDGSMQYTYIEKLSGGEKRRLQLLRVLMENPNFLILDEPTNDLDIETLKILEDFIDSFVGIVITVSHDRYFLDRICNKIFSFEGNGEINIYHGNYSDIVDKIKCNEDNKSYVKKEIVKKEEVKNIIPKFSYKEKIEYDTIEEEILKLEEIIEEIDQNMVLNNTNYSLLQELSNEKEEKEFLLLKKYERLEFLEKKAKEIEIYKLNKKK